MIRTKTREGAKVTSREADFLEYRQHPASSDNPVVGNTNDLGGISTDQTSKGVWYPTVQAAIQDLDSLLQGNVGDVKVNVTGDLPGGVQQLGSITFTGTINIIQESIETPVTTKVIEVLGFPITVEQGESGDQVAVKFVAAVEPYVLDSKVFAQCEQSSSDPTVVEFRHIDYRDHTYESSKKYGIEITPVMTSPAKAGIGTWVKLGQEAKTFEGATDSVTLHYFKRIS